MILGVIPARGGSKGIPKKNIKMIAGLPLIAWTIKSAQESKLLDDFIVSTDDIEIAEIAQNYGSKISQRPKKLATDTSPIIHTLQYIEEHIPITLLVLLQPTSPIRNTNRIDECIQKYLQCNSSIDTVATGFMCKYKPYGTPPKNRQELKGFFYDDGNVYVINPQLIKYGYTRNERYLPVYTTREENVEIDDDYDFWLAEQILLKRMTT